MKTNTADFESVSIKEIIDSVSWNRQRTTEELLSFIEGRHARLKDVELGI